MIPARAFLQAHPLRLSSTTNPDARELVDRSRVLVRNMLENPDEAGPNYIMLLILADQLQMLRDVFEDAELQQLKTDSPAVS